MQALSLNGFQPCFSTPYDTVQTLWSRPNGDSAGRAILADTLRSIRWKAACMKLNDMKRVERHACCDELSCSNRDSRTR